MVFLTGAVLTAAEQQFHFREPEQTVYTVSEKGDNATAKSTTAAWLEVRSTRNTDQAIKLGNRIVLQLAEGQSLEAILGKRPLQHVRTFAPDVYLLRAPDARTAAQQAEELSALSGVLVCHPVMRRPGQLYGRYAPRPNDPYFIFQWYLENRDATGAVGGPNTNARGAWAYTRGEGVLIAICDNGVEVTHADLFPAALGNPHLNLYNGQTNGLPVGNATHGTAVAGLAVASGYNQIGMLGTAPAADLSSVAIFDASNELPDDEEMYDLYRFQLNRATVQNHSWGPVGLEQARMGLLAKIALSNAVHQGRSGKGTILVQAGGNSRQSYSDASDSEFSTQPSIITVAAVRLDGRFTSYSNRGSSLLVAAPSGDFGFPSLFTTDLSGTKGDNNVTFPSDPALSDYVFDSLGFSGTSAAAPQIAGVVALILSANTNLHYRDVQQVLIHSARHFEFDDPDIRTNAAGFVFSHNVGYGVPDAGFAVQLAKQWTNRPPLQVVTVSVTNNIAIPDDGLRVLITGNDVPPNLAAIPANASLGFQVDAPTPSLPLVNIGTATAPIGQDLTGKGALIQRGGAAFVDKLTHAANAHAGLAIVYNNQGGDRREYMGTTEMVHIPAVFIGQNHGQALTNYLAQHPEAQAQIKPFTVGYQFSVTNTLLCEHVGLRINTDHPVRADIRLTLVSPTGTRSVLQERNNDTNTPLANWTYYSTQHFYEPSAGTWTLEVTDQYAGTTGNLLDASLIVMGVPITDTDNDGLDDAWEQEHFASLNSGPRDDPDKDGYQNAREQILHTDPHAMDIAFTADLSPWNPAMARLSWPSSTNFTYEVLAGSDLGAPLTVVTNLAGKFPETEWFTLSTNLTHRFFQVRATARP